MADNLADIEVLLKRSEQWNVVKPLSEKFAVLSQPEAQKLIERLLSFAPGDREPVDFRGFDRAIRLHLLEMLIERLGPEKSEQFWTRLTGNGQAQADVRLRKGLLIEFPTGREKQRDEFLRALKAKIPPRIPMVKLTFRNDPKQKVSPDNKSEGAKVLSNLGPQPDSGLNVMEIPGTVSGHRPGAQYDFGRTVEWRNWFRVNGNWIPQADEDYKKPGTDDNKGKWDKDELPEAPSFHIYAEDTPGFPDVPPEKGGRLNATECVFMVNAIETLHVRVGSDPWQDAATLEWCSVTWLEKVDGKWRRKPLMNVIKVGSIFGLDMPEPPTDF